MHLFSCQSLVFWICALLHLRSNAFHHLCPFSGCSPLCLPTLAASTSHRGRACCQPAQAAPASPPLIHQYFPNIIFIISVIFPSLFHFFSQSIFALSKPCASSKRSCTTLPPSINTTINRFNHHYLCDVLFNMYLLGVQIPSLFPYITPQIRNVVVNFWDL